MVNSRAQGIALALLATICWGSAYPVAKIALGMMESTQLAAIRWCLASILLAALSGLSPMRVLFASIVNLRNAFILSILGVVAYTFLLYKGVEKTTASHAAIIHLLVMPITMVVDSLLSKSWPSKRKLFLGGAALISAGSFAAWRYSHINELGSSTLIGDLLVFAAVICFAAYTALIKKLPTGATALGLTLQMGVIGTLVMTSLSWVVPIFPSSDLFLQNDNGFVVIGILIYFAAVPTIISTISWIRAVEILGPSGASGFSYLVAPLGVALSVIAVEKTIPIPEVVFGIFLLIILIRFNHAELKPSPNYEPRTCGKDS
jgi:drug/metabolite transporter (DMT)-like permease